MDASGHSVTISFRVHGRKRPPSMRSSTVKKRPGRQPRPSTGPHPLPGHELYIHRIEDESFSSDRAHHTDLSQHHVLRPKGVPMSYAQPAPPSAHKRMGHSPRSSGSRSPNPHDRRHSPPPPSGEFVQQQQQHLRVIEQAIANGQRTQPASTAGLDYALGGSRPRGSRQPQAEEVGAKHPTNRRQLVLMIDLLILDRVIVGVQLITYPLRIVKSAPKHGALITGRAMNKAVLPLL